MHQLAWGIAPPHRCSCWTTWEGERAVHGFYQWVIWDRVLQAKSLHRKCNILVAQVDALELKCSQSEALEKETAEVLRKKDEEVGLKALCQGSNTLNIAFYPNEAMLYVPLHITTSIKAHSPLL